MEAIPYERQQDGSTCGPASLCMAYRSLGLAVTQAEIWERVAGVTEDGSWGARTHRLAADALERGLRAVVLQARDPWLLLEHVTGRGLRIVLHHRLHRGSALGHFSVLVGLEATHAVVHDPFHGEGQKWSREQMLALWGPAGDAFLGGIAIVLGHAEMDREDCDRCHVSIPEATTCPECRQGVPLYPAALGCSQGNCLRATWRRLFCPFCDAVLSLAPPATKESEPGMKIPDELHKVPAALENYRSLQVEAMRVDPANPFNPLLGQLVEKMQTGYQDLLQAMADHELDTAEVQKRIEEGLQQTRKQVAEKLKETPPPPPKPPARPARARRPVREIDPELAAKLSGQVLREFGLRPLHQTGPASSQEVWQEWEKPDRHSPILEASPRPAAAPPPAPEADDPHECLGIDHIPEMLRKYAGALLPVNLHTPAEAVEAMFQLASVTARDVVYDLGCGDGRIVVAAAQKYGTRAVGIDIDPDRVREARARVEKAGVGHLVTIQQADALTVDVRAATVVLLFMGKQVNLKLRETFRRHLPPGARIVSHEFRMGDWEPVRSILVNDRKGNRHRLHLWKMKAAAQTGEVADLPDWDNWDDWVS